MPMLSPDNAQIE